MVRPAVLQHRQACYSSASYEVHQLEAVASGNIRGAQLLPVEYARPVVLHYYQARVQAERCQQLLDIHAFRHFALLAVHRNRDHAVSLSCRAPRNAVRYCSAASCTSGACQMPPRTATPCAPLRASSTVRGGVTPPIASTGTRECSAISRNASTPRGSRRSCERVW